MTIDRPITIAIIIVVTALLVFFLVLPEYNTFVSLQGQLAEKTAEYKAQYDYYSSIDKNYFDLQSHQDDIKKIDDALSQDSILGKTIYFLQDTASANGLILKDLFLSQSAQSQDASSASQSIKNMTFSADLSGSYSSLGSFIVSLEKSSHIFEVTSISFGSEIQNPSASQSQSQGQPQIQLQSQNQTQSSGMYNFSLQIISHSY